MKKFITRTFLHTILAILFLLPINIHAVEIHVTPNGSPDGDGSLNNPYDLKTIFSRGNPVQPGDVVWVHDGLYLPWEGGFDVYLNGTSDNPITVIGYPGARARIASGIRSKGKHIIFARLDVHDNDSNHYDSGAGSQNFGESNGAYGLYDNQDRLDPTIVGANNRYINNFVAENAAGFFGGSSAENIEYYGNIFINNGWRGSDRMHGHGGYAQNNPPFERHITQNIFTRNLGSGLNMRGTLGAYVGNFYVKENVFIRDIALMGSTIMENVHIERNLTYRTRVTDNPHFQIGYTLENDRATRINDPQWGHVGPVYVRDNYFVGGLRVGWMKPGVLTMTGNTIVKPSGTPGNLADPFRMSVYSSAWHTIVPTYHINNNSYHGYHAGHGGDKIAIKLTSWTYDCPTPQNPYKKCTPTTSNTFSQWQSRYGQDSGSTWSEHNPTQNKIYVFANKYEKGRGHITVYNWEMIDTARGIDVTSLGLTPGEVVLVTNAEDPIGKTLEITITGGARSYIDIPLNDWEIDHMNDLANWLEPQIRLGTYYPSIDQYSGVNHLDSLGDLELIKKFVDTPTKTRRYQIRDIINEYRSSGDLNRAVEKLKVRPIGKHFNTFIIQKKNLTLDDLAGYFNGTLPEPPAPDTTPPSIQKTEVTPEETTASLLVEINEPSKVEVTYWDPSVTLPQTSSYRTAHTINITGLTPNRVYNYHVRAEDSAGNISQSSNLTFRTKEVDTTPPTLSNISVNGIWWNGATVNWSTNENADSQVEYGTTQSLGTFVPLDSSLKQSHSMALNGLQEDTNYYYRVLSKDSDGNLATSSIGNFSTIVRPPSNNYQVGVPIEAENGLLPNNAMVGESSSGAFGNSFVRTNTTNQGEISFDIEIPQTGTYYIWTRVLAPTAGEDSFFVTVNGLNVAHPNNEIFDVAENNWTPNWQWSRVVGRNSANQPASINPREFNLSAGVHTLRFRGRERTGLDQIWITGDINFTPPNTNPGSGPDTTPPTIGSIQATPQIFEASVSATTNESSTAQVEYWTGNNARTTVNMTSNNGLNHSLSLTGLTDDTDYSYKIIAQDTAGNEAQSQTQVFRTNERPPAGNPQLSVDAGSNIQLQLSQNVDLVATVQSDQVTGIAYSWSKVSGPGEVNLLDHETISANASFTQVGDYVIQIRVTGNAGAIEATDNVQVTVHPDPDPEPGVTLSVDAGLDKRIRKDQELRLVANVTSNGINSLTYDWKKVSGPGELNLSSLNTPDSRVSFTKPGRYEIEIHVKGNNGTIEATDRVVIRVAHLDVRAGSDRAGVINKEIALDALVTTVELERYVLEWSVKSGPGNAHFSSPSSLNPKVRFSAPGEYELELKASGDGITYEVKDSLKVLVNADPAQAVVEGKNSFRNVIDPKNQKDMELSYGVKTNTHVLIRVFDRRGHEVVTLVDKTVPVGTHTTKWDGRNQNGDKVASGTYRVLIKIGDNKPESYKAVIIR